MSSAPRPARTAVLLLAAALLALAVAAPAAPAAVSTVTTPNPGTSNTIGGLTAFPTNDVWAVGSASSSSYSGCHGRTLTARFTGSAFSRDLRDAGGDADLRDRQRRFGQLELGHLGGRLGQQPARPAPAPLQRLDLDRRRPARRCRRRRRARGACTPPA